MHCPPRVFIQCAAVQPHLEAVYHFLSVRLGNDESCWWEQLVVIRCPLGWHCTNRLLPLQNSFLAAICFTLRWHHFVMPLLEENCSWTSHSFRKSLKGFLWNTMLLSASISVGGLYPWNWASKWSIMLAVSWRYRWHQTENCVDPHSTSDRLCLPW